MQYRNTEMYVHLWGKFTMNELLQSMYCKLSCIKLVTTLQSPHAAEHTVTSWSERGCSHVGSVPPCLQSLTKHIFFYFSEYLTPSIQSQSLQQVCVLHPKTIFVKPELPPPSLLWPESRGHNNVFIAQYLILA